MRVDVMHYSAQTQDTLPQKAADAAKVFARARARDVWWLTGTEANNAADARVLQNAAKGQGFRFITRGGDVWVAVDPSRATGTITAAFTLVIHGKAHRYPNRGVLRVSFTTEQLGRITVLAAHYNLIRGSGEEDNPQLAKEIAKQARKYGRGSALVFYGGDQNLSDRREDTFLGAPLTSAWDELGHYQPTHDRRTIDVIASYNRDGRVSAAYCRSLQDAQLALHTDHYPVEAGFDVTPLR